MARRQSNRPDRRLATADALDVAAMAELPSRARYVGSALHKLRPGDYGFVPSHNPRPTKSVCDDLRPVPMQEAKELLLAGIACGMVSPFPPGGVPKYVWAVDEAGEVYEAKTDPRRGSDYHGYRLGDDEEDMRRYILKEWKRRCPRS